LAARKSFGRHATPINTGVNDPAKVVSKNVWNEDPAKDGMFGHTPANITVATNIISPVDTLNIVAGEGAADDVIDFCNLTSDPAIAEGDYVKLLKGSQVITVNHNTGSPPANHAPFLLLGGVTSKTLDANVQMVFQRRGNNLVECTLTKDITNSLLKSGTFPNITGIGAQSQNLDMNSNKIVNATDPTNPQDVATKFYVDAIAAGLKWKDAVRVATTAAGTLASDFENGDTVDGVVLATGDRILIKNQTDQTQNGIYTVNASGAPTRATDADTGSELVQAAVFVKAGTVNADQGFVCTNDSITIGSTNITFTQFTGTGQIDAGIGLTKTGNTLNFDIDELASETVIDDANDTVPFKDASASNTPKEMTINNLMKGKYIIPIPIGAFFKKTTGGTSEDLTQEEFATNKINIKKYSFDQSTDEGIQIQFPTPDTWDGGSVEVQFIWKANATSGTARWGAKGRSYGDGETIDQAMGTEQEIDDAVTATANQVLISGWTPAITLGGTPVGGEFVIMEIFRNADHANDTLAADAALLGVRVRLSTNKKADG
jgi:hypothetical protein